MDGEPGLFAGSRLLPELIREGDLAAGVDDLRRSGGLSIDVGGGKAPGP
jgi:hypothetical protein